MEIQKLKNYLKQTKISYEKLAEMSNITLSTIKHILGGQAKNPRVDTMKAIEGALNIQEFNLVDTKLQIMVNLFSKLTTERKTEAIEYLKYLNMKK